MMDGFNWIDYIIIAIFFFSILVGVSRGLVREMIGLLTLIVAVVVAIMFAHPLAQVFTHSASVENAVNQASNTVGMDTGKPVTYLAVGVCFTIVFFTVNLIGTLIGYTLNLFFQYGMIGLGNRLLGGVFGIGKGFIYNLVFIFLVQTTAFSTQPVWQASVFVRWYQPYVQWLSNLIAPSMSNLKNKLTNTLENVNSSVQGTVNEMTQ